MDNSPGAETRRSTRLSISIPIVIHGKDAQQKAFKEKTHTLIVNKHGAKLATSHQLAVGTQILIENPTMGSAGEANIVWVSAKRSSQGLHEVGVQLVEAQNIWGLEFPPDDWTNQEKDQGMPAANEAIPPLPAPVENPSAQISPRALASAAKPTPTTRPALVKSPPVQTPPPGLASAAKPAPATRPALVESPPAQTSRPGSASAAKPAPATRPAPVEIPPAQTSRPGSASEELATQFLQELHETTDAHARKFRERLDEVVEQVRLQLEMDLRGRAGAAREEEFAAIEQQVLASCERLTALKAEMAELDARLEVTRQGLGATLDSVPPPLTTEQIQEKIEAEALPVLHLITEGGIAAARERFQTEVQADFGKAVAAWRDNLSAERDSIMEEARQQIMAEVNSALEILNRNRDAGLKEMKHYIQEEIQANKERVVSQIKSKLDVAAESHGASLIDQLNETVRETGERQKNLLQTQLDDLLASRLDQAQGHVQSLEANLQERVGDGLRAAGEKITRELQARLQEISDQTVASASDQTRAQIEKSASATAEKSLQAWQARLQEIADQTVASSSDQVRVRVEESANAFAEKSFQDWQTRLQEIADQTIASSSDPIRKQVEESAQVAAENALQEWKARLKDVADLVIDSSSQQMRGHIEEAARGTAEKGLQAWQTRLQEIADQTLAASSDQIRARVEESAQAVADKALQAWQVRLQEVAEGAATSSSDQVRGRINEALSLMGPKLQEMQERAVNDAVEAFRGRLSQFLGLLPSGGIK
ncbi:MAG: hypothetical protein ABSF45_04830 [Terriglobia bacterium]|jgi:hypothetical protein